MKYGDVKSEIGRICRSAVRFIDKSVSSAMGCFFACFRIRDAAGRRRMPHLVSRDFTRSLPVEAVISKNHLSSPFTDEEEEDCQSHDKEIFHLNSPDIEKEVRDEAKFLKACGTLAETPVEIRKASKRLKDSPPFGKELESSKFHSWLSKISKLQIGEEIDKSSTPVKHFDRWAMDFIASEHAPNSCISDVNNTGRISTSSNGDREAGSNLTTVIKFRTNQIDNVTTSVSPWPSAPNIQSKNKLVRFECDIKTSSSKDSSENGWQNSKKFEFTGELSVSKSSPKPTPLKLSDEMQTPGTVFPTSVEILDNGKTKIRSQYVYSVLDPVENMYQKHALKEYDSDSHHLSSESLESIEQLGKQIPKSQMQVEETSFVKDLIVEGCSLNRLNPAHDGDNPNVGTASIKSFCFGRTPGDRPIIGMVTANWNKNEPSHISSKWWDENGIPNSTKKYKEDQKVSWHATPFEERLEKALSEESLISQKKNINGRPIIFDEYGESDIALPQLQALTRS